MRLVLKHAVVLAGVAFAVPATAQQQRLVSAPGGLALGQSVEGALQATDQLFFGDTCYGERAVFGDVLTDKGFVHVMGYVDEKTGKIDAVEAAFPIRRSVSDARACEAHVRAMAQKKFPGGDWTGASVRNVFLGGADRIHLSVERDGVTYEAWGDMEMIVGLQCSLSWRASAGGRRFDVRRIRAN